MLPPYVNSLATRWHTTGNPTASFSVSAILCIPQIWPQLEIAIFFLLIIISYNYIVGEAWLVFLGVLLGTSVSFFLPFLYLGDEHGKWLRCSFHMGSICHVFSFCALPRASYEYIWCGLTPSVVWKFCNTFQLL